MAGEVDPAQIEKTLLTFLESRTRHTWQPETDLFASGSVTSLFAMELVVFLERTFDVAVTGADLSLANFRTVHAMTAMVRRLREAS
jgi:methoxymalonate biosynthesis acyl carrier protein